MNACSDPAAGRVGGKKEKAQRAVGGGLLLLVLEQRVSAGNPIQAERPSVKTADAATSIRCVSPPMLALAFGNGPCAVHVSTTGSSLQSSCDYQTMSNSNTCPNPNPIQLAVSADRCINVALRLPSPDISPRESRLESP